MVHGIDSKTPVDRLIPLLAPFLSISGSIRNLHFVEISHHGAVLASDQLLKARDLLLESPRSIKQSLSLGLQVFDVCRCRGDDHGFGRHAWTHGHDIFCLGWGWLGISKGGQREPKVLDLVVEIVPVPSLNEVVWHSGTGGLL